MNFILRAIVAITSMVLIMTAPAGNAFGQMRPFYGGAFGGYVIPQNMNWEDKSTGDNFDLHVDETGMIGFKLGYILPQARVFALELEYYHIFEHNYGPGGNSFVIEAGDLYLDNFFFNLIIRYPRGRIHPYIGAGIGFSDTNSKNIETTARLSVLQEETVSSFAWQFLAGLNFEIAPGLSADLTYRYFGTDPHLEFVDLKYRASILSAGINFHF